MWPLFIVVSYAFLMILLPLTKTVKGLIAIAVLWQDTEATAAYPNMGNITPL